MRTKKFEGLGTKIDPAMAEVLDKICNILQVDVYHLLQWFAYTIIRAAAPWHELDPRIQKIMTILESDVGWQKAFNMADPDGLDVAQVILILEQQNHKGFGAVMIDKPWMGKKPKMVQDLDPMRGDPQMTENVDDILERVTQVTMRGIYRRLREVGGMMGCDHLSDILLNMIDDQIQINTDMDIRMHSPAYGDRLDSGREYAYGKKTKAKHHRTPDSVADDQRIKQQTITFDAYDREMADIESKGWKGDEP